MRGRQLRTATYLAPSHCLLLDVRAPVLMLASICSLQLAASVAAAPSLTELGAPALVAARLLVGGSLVAAVSPVGFVRLVGRPAVGQLWLALLGVLMAVDNLAFYAALRTVPIGIAVAVAFVGPLAVAAWGSSGGTTQAPLSSLRQESHS